MQFPSYQALKLNALLRTTRLIIEPITAVHADLLFAPMQDEAIYQWISTTPPKSINQLKEWWAKRESRLSPDGDEAWLNWAVKRAIDGVYVGKIDAEINLDNIATNIGYIFFPPFWGQGYASESVIAIAEHFSTLGVSKAVATVTLGNSASYRVLEKAGFKKSRVIRESDLIRGVKYDDVEFVRLFEK